MYLIIELGEKSLFDLGLHHLEHFFPPALQLLHSRRKFGVHVIRSSRGLYHTLPVF